MFHVQSFRACSHYKNIQICEPDFSQVREIFDAACPKARKEKIRRRCGNISRKDVHSLMGTRPSGLLRRVTPRNYGVAFIIFIFMVLLPLSISAANDDHPLYQSASVLVMCANSGDVLYETEGYTLRYPASITKVMTALLVLEYVQDLEERVVFSYHSLDIPYYASRMWMHEGESISVLEGLYGIMLPSGNEVARALAEHVSGTVPAFVNRMNSRAAELGALNTRFINPCGLPGDGQYVTAYDVALIMRAALQFPVFADIISTVYFELQPTNMYDNTRLLRNTNRLIRTDTDEYDPFVIGGKTGFTNAAQHTLVSYARRGNYRLIVSVLYAPPLATFTDTTALANMVFDMLETAEREAAEAAARIAELERQAALEALRQAELAAELEAEKLRIEAELAADEELATSQSISTVDAMITVALVLLVVMAGLFILAVYQWKVRRR